MGKGHDMVPPLDDEGWAALRADINEAFSPGSPIRARTELSGRAEQIQRLCDIMLRAGEHAIVFGERGVGKTSLARTFHSSLHTSTRRVTSVYVNCVENDDFGALWRKVFKRMSATTPDGQSDTLASLYSKEIDPDDVFLELSGFALTSLPIIVFDEFDRIGGEQTKDLFTDTIKLLSDDGSHCKIVLVGVGEDVSTLVARHRSIFRNLKQVGMPRLNPDELKDIVAQRVRRCGMTISGDALFQIAFLSRGFPYYCHLLGQFSALEAAGRRRTAVTEADVINGLTAALQDVDQTITESYLQATVSQRPDETLYEPVLIACALADSDDLGRFQQSAVTAPLSEIAKKSPPYTPTTFAFHMNEFCDAKRGNVLTRSGEPRNYRYRFNDPMMQPYVIIRALRTGRLGLETFRRFITRQQRQLFS